MVRAGGGSGLRNGPSILVGANGLPLSAAPEPVELVDVAGETLSALTWADYIAWRKTKCRPFDYVDGPRLALTTSEARPNELTPYGNRALEEIDQATLEFIGEVAELGEMLIKDGPAIFYGELRDKLIDECGDILFTGTWALDAWGNNPLADADDLELIRVTDEDAVAQFAQVIAGNPAEAVFGDQRFISMLGGMLFNLMLTAQTAAGLTANSFKKLKYQRREQNVDAQVGRIVSVLFSVNQILIVANSSVAEALKVNQRKINARFPDGYKPGQGGGHRVGEGK